MWEKEKFGEIKYSMFQDGSEAELHGHDDEIESLLQVVRAAYVRTNRRIPGLIDAGFIHTQEQDGQAHVVFGFVVDTARLEKGMREKIDVQNFFVHLQMLNSFYLAYAYYINLSRAQEIYPRVAVIHFDRRNLRRVIENRIDFRMEKTWLLYNRLNTDTLRTEPIQLRKLEIGDMRLQDLLRQSRPILHIETKLRHEDRALRTIYSER